MRLVRWLWIVLVLSLFGSVQASEFTEAPYDSTLVLDRSWGRTIVTVRDSVQHWEARHSRITVEGLDGSQTVNMYINISFYAGSEAACRAIAERLAAWWTPGWKPDFAINMRARSENDHFSASIVAPIANRDGLMHLALRDLYLPQFNVWRLMVEH